MLDLSGLEAVENAAAKGETYGKPLELLLRDIEEDPNQPRRQFDPESMKELTESIRLHGVKTPVSVRSNPSQTKQWILNYGARRYRASLQAGKTTIPAFIDQQHTSYQQVIENVQRENLSPMELALFIHQKLGEGVTKTEIARSLSMDAATVTQHLALIYPPACIEEIYAKGTCTSPKTLYELRSLHVKFPTEVERWCERSTEITRGGVADLALKLKAAVHKKKAPGDTRVQDQGAGESGESALNPVFSTKGPASSPRAIDRSDGAVEQGSEAPEPYKLIVSVEDRRARVLFSHKPKDPQGLVIEFDTGEHREVPAQSCRIEQLIF